ncbi:MAG: hypothetical protein NC915_01665 [Candidatus Omnitrophica bacterium]|nr:hypothetical protein [Candidatus Omnitrophota bacterium]
MALTEEEKNRIIEEEKLRVKTRLKYEQKSSGLAGVLSSICPGLGQIYNGSLRKAILIGLLIIISIIMLSLGITFQIKGVPAGKGKTSSIQEEKEFQITEEGVVIEKSEKEEEKIPQKKPKSPYLLTILGVMGLCYGWNYAIRDAIETAKKLNEEVLKNL